jgi:flagellar biosynthesis protein FlhF
VCSSDLTTIGKLATRYVLKHGAESVALVTTDRYRIAAHEQLRTLGKILQVTVTAVDDENSLDSVLDSLRNKQLILIDTAGINAAHRNFNEQLLQLNQVSNRITPLLVLAATSQIRVQAAEYAAYTQLNPIAAVITKIDEAASLGESLGLLIANNLPVAYESHGQSIPGDIAVADAQLLVSRAVQISRHKPINKEQMVAGFNAASTNTGSTEASAASIS